MTREEAKEDVVGYGWSDIKIVDHIYDDSQSRRCENCKYVENDNYMFCSLADNAFFKGDRLFKAIVNDNMSCSNFKRKEDDK